MTREEKIYDIVEWIATAEMDGPGDFIYSVVRGGYKGVESWTDEELDEAIEEMNRTEE